MSFWVLLSEAKSNLFHTPTFPTHSVQFWHPSFYPRPYSHSVSFHWLHLSVSCLDLGMHSCHLVSLFIYLCVSIIPVHLNTGAAYFLYLPASLSHFLVYLFISYGHNKLPSSPQYATCFSVSLPLPFLVLGAQPPSSPLLTSSEWNDWKWYAISTLLSCVCAHGWQIETEFVSLLLNVNVRACRNFR